MVEHVALGAAFLAALTGLALGLTALANPGWAGRLVRLMPDPDRREGQGELRANYGGLFTGLHAACVVALGAGVVVGDPIASVVAAFVLSPVGLGWLVLGLVRLAFAKADGAVTRYNIAGAGFELVMGLTLAAPSLLVLTGVTHVGWIELGSTEPL